MEKTIREKIYHSILDDILSNEYKPNQILNEKALVEKYNYSKSPVREALISLCNDNVLRSLPRVGYEVVKFTAEDISEMLQFRFVLESGLLRETYLNITKSQIDLLRAVNQTCNAADFDIWQHWESNTEFHLKLAHFSDNHYAEEALMKCMKRLKWAYTQFYWGRWDAAATPADTQNHQLIIAAIEGKNFDDILRYLKADLNDFGGPRVIGE